MFKSGSKQDIPHKSSRINKQDDKFFSRLLSRESCRMNSSSRVLYYSGEPSAVPFTWESRPGTPIHGKSKLGDLGKDVAYIPPLTPPPSYYSKLKYSRTTTVPNIMHNRNSKPKFLHTIFSKLAPKKARVAGSPSRSSASSPSSSSNWSRPYTFPSSSTADYIHHFDMVPIPPDSYMTSNMSRERNKQRDKLRWCYAVSDEGNLDYPQSRPWFRPC